MGFTSYSPPITTVGPVNLTSANRGVISKNSPLLVLFALVNSKKQEIAVSAGVTKEGKGFDAITPLAKMLGVAPNLVKKVEDAKTDAQNLKATVALAEALVKYFKIGRDVKLVHAKQNGKLLYTGKGKDRRALLNIEAAS